MSGKYVTQKDAVKEYKKQRLKKGNGFTNFGIVGTVCEELIGMAEAILSAYPTINESESIPNENVYNAENYFK